MENKLLRIAALTASIFAIAELAVSQFTIRITRLSANETTGIILFAFVISSLVTLFAVTRMKDSPWARLFAVIMNFITAASATWYIMLLFSDEIFIRNIFYTLNRRTQSYDPLPLGRQISSGIPLGLVMLGAIVYYLCGIAIIIAGAVSMGKNKK